MTYQELFSEIENRGGKAYDTIERLSQDRATYIAFLNRLSDDQNIVLLGQAIDTKAEKQAEMAGQILMGMAVNLGLLPLAEKCTEVLSYVKNGNISDAKVPF